MNGTVKKIAWIAAGVVVVLFGLKFLPEKAKAALRF